MEKSPQIDNNNPRSKKLLFLALIFLTFRRLQIGSGYFIIRGKNVHKFPITEYKKFSELPLDKFNTLKFSVYILDFNWRYMFVNEFAKSILGKRGEGLIGKNIWDEFPELQHDPAFKELRIKMEKRVTANMIVVSPVHGHRQNITGYALDDCLYFSSSILPDKQNLIEELRQQLSKKK